MPDERSPTAENPQAFIARLIETGCRQALPELFSAAPPEALYVVPNRGGVGVVALRTTALREEQLLKLLRYRWGQYLHPAVGIHDPCVAWDARMEHEPLSEVLPDDVHVIAGDVETGVILCYAVIRTLPEAPPGATLRTQDRPLFTVEKFHGWGIYNRLRTLPDLPLSRICELGRFVKNQGIPAFSEPSARAPVEIGAAVGRLLIGPLREEIDALVGDLEEGVSKQNLDFFHIPTVLIRGTVPYVPEETIAFPRYQYRTIFPVAFLVADLDPARPRLEAIEQALNLPGRQGLLALFALLRDTDPPRSSLEPPEGLGGLTTTEMPQQSLPMPERRELLDFGVRLRATGLFHGLSVAEAAILGSFMERQEIPAGEVLIRQGDPGQDLFVIQEGSAEVSVRDRVGNSRVVAHMGPGDHLGEIALLHGGERTADVVATTPLTVMCLTKEAYLRFLTHVTDVEQEMARTAAERLKRGAGDMG